MHDRLIELIKKAKQNWSLSTMVHCDFETWIADYLLENGIIVPPCKVGDTVYVINVRYKTLEGEENNIPDHSIEEAVVTGIKYQLPSSALSARFYIFTNKTPSLVSYPLNLETEINIHGIFLTREEAERALEGGADE